MTPYLPLVAFVIEIALILICTFGLGIVLLNLSKQRVDLDKLRSAIKYFVLACLTIIAALSHQLMKNAFATASIDDGNTLNSMITISAIIITSGCLVLALVKLRSDTKLAEDSTTKYSEDEKIELKVFKNSSAPILILDTDNKILITNEAAEKLLTKSQDALKDSLFEDLVVRHDAERVRDFFLQFITQKRSKYSIEIRLKSDARIDFWVKIFPSLVELDDGTLALSLYLQDISEQKSLSELIAFHAYYDELTMLHNREGLERYLDKALKINRSINGQVALLYFDIDQLKVINDTCGHAAGDQLIQYLITEINQAGRSCQFFARIGGDEFALVKLNSNEAEAKSLAESIRSAAEDFTFFWKDSAYRQTISVGVALTSSEVNSTIDLLGAADSACDRAKEQGRNRVVFASQSDSVGDSERGDMLWVSRLNKAIVDGNFELYFQPIEKTHKQSDRYIHYEILIRYEDENGEHILPKQFLPAVERFGFSEQVDLWVLTTTLDFLDRHPAHTERLFCCSINLTTQSIANPRTRSAILQVLAGYQLVREKICFEITEKSAIQNLLEAKEFIHELKKLGCRIALDDFGTGFSSFGYLKHLPVDYIKIDGSFVRDILKDNFDRAMVSAMTNIGKELEIGVIAEYAESKQILKALEKMDVEFAQGYGLSKPMPISLLEGYYM